jgi:integrase/recombinase XerD
MYTILLYGTSKRCLFTLEVSFFMSEKTIKKRREPVKRRAIVSEDIQQMELQPAFSYFISAKLAEGIRERTKVDYSNTWRYLTDWFREQNYDIKNVSDITPQMCRAYFHYITVEAPRYKGHIYIQNDQGIGLSSATINMRIRSLKVAFNFWLRENFIARSPMDNIRCQKTDIDKIESFTNDQIDSLLGACDKRSYVGFRDFVFQVVLLDSAMRINEALSLTRESVDLKSRCIELEAKFNKNRKSRVVPLSVETVKLLKELIEENLTHFPKTDKIFLSCYGEELSDRQANKRLTYYGQITGVGEKIRVSAHTYRHTAARNYVLNGGDPYTLMRLLGHSSLHMTRRYIQMTDEDLKTQHDQFSPISRIRKRLR